MTKFGFLLHLEIPIRIPVMMKLSGWKMSENKTGPSLHIGRQGSNQR